MSKNLKKAISLLLTIGVLSSAAGITVSAADEETAPAAETTESTEQAAETPAEATEAPAEAPAVQAPAAQADTSTDSYYNEAVGLVTALNIVQGYEDGSIRPDNTITRAEMATMILRMMGIDTVSSAYTNAFTDVTSSHWAANYIQTAYDMGIINGMGDGTFAPDANVTYAQAVKMLVCALKYDQLAINMGGFPSGYLTAAGQKNIEITKNASGFEGTTPATRGVVIKMIYNTLNALYPTGSGLTADGVEFKTEQGRTLASELLEIYEVEGIITATSKMSIDSAADPADDQILIDGEIYYKGSFEADGLVGYKVKAYYYEHDGNGLREIVYAVPKTKQDTLTIDGDDVESIEDIRSDSGKINYYANKSTTKTKAAKCKAPVIIYNGKIITAEDVPSDKTLEEFITPEVGKVVLNDYDNDGYYDVIFIDSYKTYVVTSATDSSITAKYEVNGSKKLNVDLEDDDLDLTIIKDGSKIDAKRLKKWDILTVLESANKTGDRIMNIQVSTKTIEGKVTEYDADKEERDYFAKIDGKQYEIDETFALSGDIEVGDEGVFHLDSLGRIAAVEGTSGSKLSSGQEYGWMIWAKEDSSTQNKTIKMFTQSGSVKTFEIADRLSFYGPEKDQVVTNLSSKTEEELEKELSKYSGWSLSQLKKAEWDGERTLRVNDDESDWEELMMAEDVIEMQLASNAYQMKLVRYNTDSKGRIKELSMPILTTNYQYEDDDRPVILNINMDGVDGGSNLIDNRYLMTNELVRFTAPEKIDDVNDTSTYAYDKVAGTSYVAREGVSKTYFLAEFDGKKPTLVIEYVGSSSDPSDYNYNSADDTPLMMISKIQQVYDEDDERDVYKITGYANGNKVTYTTSKTTSISMCNATGGSATDNRSYAYKKLWSAVKSEYNLGEDSPECKDIKDAIKVGDIVGVKTSGNKVNTMVKFVDAKDAEELDLGVIPSSITCLTNGDLNGRDGFGAGKIDDVDADDMLTIAIRGGSNIALDPGYYVDIYNTRTGKVEEGELVSDLIPYDDDDGTGDLIVVRTYRMNVREVFAIRFE
ncbi:MAG: S-layer homology domain-containing protein [Oscillospiraceae bacterium]|nr:S-layer homology domain-containing protein [Oscillospiraceae bacterium]